MQDAITAILVEDFDIPAEELGLDVTFEALGLDSLDVVDLTLALEERTPQRRARAARGGGGG